MADRWASTNLPSRSEQREVKRAALISQAAKAFKARGFQATTMDDIASSLGVTKGALYRYVSNKQDILFECFMSSNRIGNAAIARANAFAGSGLEKLQTFILDFIENYLAHNTAGGAMVDIDALFPEQREQVIAERDRIDAALRKLIAGGIADGSIAPGNAKLAELTVMGSINWIPSWYRPDGSWTPQLIAQTMSSIFSDGLRARPASNPAPRKKPARGR
ncbi:TetR/AcrR family transcriptional regulator [Variovorax defluvii]|uniref:TetR/AcrR family transcriptional regulator n=1 Tax=Variovorax defluvii TaxID=913761 RepID=A0ABP8HF00_9BURK